MSQLDSLAVGRRVSVWPLQSHWSLPQNGLVATIENIFPDKICLRFSKPVPPPSLQEGEGVRIKSWTGEALYFWDAEILKMSDSAKQQLTISILGDEMQRIKRL